MVKHFSRLLTKPKSSPTLLMLFGIILLAAALRLYKIHELSVFLADQAIMSTAVLNILRGDITLLGPKASVGEFFFGPIVYYLMTPFYAVFQGYPLAGTVFQTTIHILTVPLIFLIGKKVRDEKTGLVAAFLFAISALIIDYARATFNTTPALFFSTLIIYIFFSIITRYRWWKVLIMGILMGWIVQMNFITASLLIAIFFYPLLFHRKMMSIQFYGLMILGFFIGFSPYLLFEIRNNFFNFNEMFRYIFGRTSGGGRSVIYIFTDIPVIVSKLLYGVANIWIGWATILFMIITGIVYIKHKENTTYYNFILFLIGIVLIVSLLYGKHLESYYLITIHTSIRIFFAAFVVYILGKRTVLLGVFLLIMLLVNMPYWNVQKPIHDLQDGLAMRDFDKAAQIIREDNGSVTFNVAMDAQRDNRAIPLRYFLTLYDVPVMHYDDYGSAPYLYFIAGTDKPLSEITVWEYTSFGSDDIVTSWILNDEYTLYKLTK